MHRALATLLLVGCTGTSPAPDAPPTAPEASVAEPAPQADGESLVIIHSGEVQAELEPCG